jgi:hypothetical protein
MSFGKSSGGGTSYTTPELTPEQRRQIAAQTEFFTGTIAPTYNEAVRGATDIYNTGVGGVTQAAQNLAGTASQAQQSLGETGESALRTGITGLQNLFGRDYEQQQLAAALLPAQQQYMQNLAAQQVGFGGAGNLGSARSALAQTALAGQAQAQQQAAAAGVLRDIAAQRAGVGTTLAQLGQGGIGQALGAAGQGVTAAMTPQQLYNQYASVIFGTPAASYNPDFRGTQGSTVTTNDTRYNFGVGGGRGLFSGTGL